MESLVTLICSCGCGTEFTRAQRQVNATGANYVSIQHAAKHRTKLYLVEMCGDFLPIMMAYLESCQRRNLKSTASIRSSLAPFFLFLTEKNFTDIKRIKPRDIDDYLTWAEEVEYQNAQHSISTVSAFFKWANQYQHHIGPNPVIHKFHGARRPVHLPRPYSEDEMEAIWEMAQAGGTSMIRAILAIGEEAGLRNSELCRLRVGDVDLTGMTLFVRLPNKTDEERFAFIHEKAVKYITEWMTERAPASPEDPLFLNTRGDSLSPETLHRTCCRVFCKHYGGKLNNPHGLESWSTHRLRHTMASSLISNGASVAVVMEAGGWRSFSALSHYAKMHLAAARRGYDEAMVKVRASENTSSTVTYLSNDDFLATYDRAV
jgi:integrase/recombinase XerC